jgi:uncharacterized membrane protein (UPF0127 family)
MAFSIDVVTLDRSGTVLGTWSHVRPWRMKVFGRDTRCVLELASGSIQRTDIEVGDVLQFLPRVAVSEEDVLAAPHAGSWFMPPGRKHE